MRWAFVPHGARAHGKDSRPSFFSPDRPRAFVPGWRPIDFHQRQFFRRATFCGPGQDTGCDAQPSGRRCIDLRKDGKTFARGFPIDSSESHIALFDVIEKRARALERDGTELLVDPTRDKPDTKK